MTAIIAPDQELLDLDMVVGTAWSGYRERLRGLTADEYERVEEEAWADLQSVLARVERRRRQLTDTAA